MDTEEKQRNAIEDILATLKRGFHEITEEIITGISSDDIYNLLFNLLRPTTLTKFRQEGFRLLLKYMNLMAIAKVQIKEVMPFYYNQ